MIPTYQAYSEKEKKCCENSYSKDKFYQHLFDVRNSQILVLEGIVTDRMKPRNTTTPVIAPSSNHSKNVSFSKNVGNILLIVKAVSLYCMTVTRELIDGSSVFFIIHKIFSFYKYEK